MNPVETRDSFLINLDSWIIQDGNYPDLHEGQTAEFALELTLDEYRVGETEGPTFVRSVGTTDPVSEPDPAGPGLPDLKETPGGLGVVVSPDPATACEFDGKVVVEGSITVIDIDLLCYFCYFDLASMDRREPIPVGTRIAGTGNLSMDCFTYYEGMAVQENVPPLIYSWHIDRILRQTAPFEDLADRTFARDLSRVGYAEVDQTRAWYDDQAHATYVLDCTLLDIPPQRTSETAIY